MSYEYRRTQVEVTPGYKKPDSVVEKKLTALQIEALNYVITAVDGGSTFLDRSGERDVKRAGVTTIRVSTDRYQRWPNKDYKVDASKQTVKPLVDAGLLKAYNSRYSPDYAITEAGIKAASSGFYGKVVNGEWVPPVMRAMTPEEQHEADLEWLQSEADRHEAKVKEAAEALCERFEDTVKSLRRDITNFGPERARRWGKDSLYFSNALIRSIHNTFNNARFDILMDAEANMLTSLIRLDALKGKVEV